MLLINAFSWTHRYIMIHLTKNNKSPYQSWFFWGWNHITKGPFTKGVNHPPTPLVIRHIASGIVSLFVDAGRRGLGQTQLCWSMQTEGFRQILSFFSGRNMTRLVTRLQKSERLHVVGSVSEALSSETWTFHHEPGRQERKRSTGLCYLVPTHRSS